MEGLGHAAIHELEIHGAKTGVLGDASEHAGTDFLAIVEGKDEVLPALARKRTVGPRLTLELPTDGKQRTKNSLCLGRGPLTHAAAGSEMLMLLGLASPYSS